MAVAIALAIPAAVAGTNAPTRPAHPLLPWHQARLDERGRLLAWYAPHRGLGYDRVLRLGWRFVERRVPVDRRAGVPVYLAYAVFDPRSRQGKYWQHNPAFLYSSFVDSLVAWYAYSGDRDAIRVVRRMLSYQLDHGTTPAGWAWPRVPFPTSCASDRRYGRCFADLPRSAYGAIEPDKVGLLGYGYLRFYQLTGERRFLRAALAAADALARRVRPGTADRTPWPFRVHARTGAVIAGAQYGGAVVGPVQLLDALARLGAGSTARYRRARDLAWRWVLRHPLNRASAAWNRWTGFFEDTRYHPGSRNQLVPTLTAYYLLTRERPASIDPEWRSHVRAMIEWVRASFGRGPFFGAWGIDEQRAPGRPGCCSPAGLGSHTSRWAAVNAVLYGRTGDAQAREDAIRSLSYATYFTRPDGRVSCCGVRRDNEFWFSDGYGDYLRSFNWAMAAMPELAPRGQNHVLGSSSVVQSVAYRKSRVEYHTFSRRSTETLRLAFRPGRVLAGRRRLPRRDRLDGEGYTVGGLAGGDFVVKVRHDRSRRVRIIGDSRHKL